MVLRVVLLIALLEGLLTPPQLTTVRDAMRDLFLARNDLRVVQPVMSCMPHGRMVTARAMWDMCQAPDASPELYTDELVIGRLYDFLAIRHPGSIYGEHGNLLAEDIDDPELNMNDVLMGPAGSGTLLHRDQPTPFATRMLVVYGRKELLSVACDVTSIPARIRTHAPGREVYSEDEWEDLKTWVLRMGGRAVMLNAGKCAQHLLCMLFDV